MKFYINRQQFVKETTKELDGNNYLVAYDVPIAKTGIQQYTREEIGDTNGDPQELVNVYRDRDVFQDEKLIQSFDGIPIVYRHPDNGRVDGNNFKDFVVGTVSGVYYKNGDLYAKKLTIIDKEAIENVLDKNTNELSIGFRGKVVKESGKFEGVPYQFKEDVIHANHLALCENGKAGSYYAINSKKGKKMNYTNSHEGHGKMKDCMDSEVPMHNIEGIIEQAVKKHMSKVHPKNFGDGISETEEHHESMVDGEEEGEEDKEIKHHMKKEKTAEHHLEKEHAMGDGTKGDLEEVEHYDKDVINSLKKTNRKFKDLINAKNIEIRQLELQNISLEEALVECREYMKNMANKLKSSNLTNAMAAPDNFASPSHPAHRDLANSITSSFLHIK